MLSAKSFGFGPTVTARQEAAFFAALRLPNGTFKTTADHRMDVLTAFVIARFSADEIRRAARNLKERLIGPGSSLIVNRTANDGTNNATLFALTKAWRFAVQARFGSGSEIEDIVLTT
jgi:hypothetical protein